MLLINSGGSGQGRGLLSTRRGTVMAAIGVAVVAGIVLLLFLHQYRQSVADEGAAAKVLVANGLIAQGSAGDTLADRRMFRTDEVRESQLQPGAVTDPAALRGRIAAHDIVPGQQLKVSDFTVAVGDVRTKISGDQRALAIGTDKVRTLNGTLRAGDRVDMLVGFNVEKAGVGKPVIKPIMSNVLVLAVPGAPVEGQPSNSGGSQAIILRVPGRYVARMAYAAAHGQIWLTIRPGAGAKEIPADPASLADMLAGQKVIDGDDGDVR